MNIISLAGTAVISAVLCVVVRQYKPDMGQIGRSFLLPPGKIYTQQGSRMVPTGPAP